jgi:glycosyltransferase involved in cell wall biosynthesis
VERDSDSMGWPAPKLSVVVPVFNSAQTLKELVDRTVAALAHFPSLEIVLVDDASRDGSWSVIQALAAERPGLIVGIRLMRNSGQHHALLAGIRAAQNPVVVTMDDDLQNPPEEIPKLVAGLTDSVDVVYGTPVAEHHGLLRNLASRTAKAALRSVTGVPEARMVSAFRAFRLHLRDAFAAYEGPYGSIDVLLSWATTRFAVVVVDHQDRVQGRSGYTVRMLIQHALNMMTGFSTKPLKLASLIGFGFAVFGFGVLAYVLIRLAIVGGSVPGFPFLASIIAIFSGAQLFALGIIGEYLARMHFRLMKRPGYTVQGTTRDLGASDRNPATATLGVGSVSTAPRLSTPASMSAVGESGSGGVLVTGVGGDVAHGVLTVLAEEFPSLRRVGTNSAEVLAGPHMCQASYLVPPAEHPGYMLEIARIVTAEAVELILPTTDAEAVMLSRAGTIGQARVAASSAAVTSTCYDKYLTARALIPAGVPFARTWLPSQVELADLPSVTIVKPRTGRGSRQVFRNHPDPTSLPDTFVIQEGLLGPELTIGGYMTRSGRLNGFIVLERELRDGRTWSCRTDHSYDEQVASLLESLTAVMTFTGSFNVQAVATSRGPVPFEINARISGTNEIRHRLGFEDVAWTVREWLLDQQPQPLVPRDGRATRMLASVVELDQPATR